MQLIRPYIYPVAQKRRRNTGPPSYTFGAKMQGIRKKKGLTQAALAGKLGISVRTVAYYEREAQNPTMQFVERVADALGVPAGALLGEGAKIRVDEVPEVIKALKVRIPKLPSLPRKDQESLAAVIDGFLAKHSSG